MKIIEGVAQMQGLSSSLKREGKTLVFVPTMGFLHGGHAELLKKGRPLGDVLVLSIFVNPTQFGPSEDFLGYPRDFERDLEMARRHGVDIVFAPKAAEMYPDGYRSNVDVTDLSGRLCGASRPGHFSGVATVVLKLFNIVGPGKALFGKKDFQQLVIIRRMVTDLNLGVEIIGVDTVREDDGLAMSSRNSYLSPTERKAASAIPASLKAASDAFRGGVREGAAIIEKVKKIIEKEPLCKVEYVNIVDPETLLDVKEAIAGSVMALAVRVGRARLIDNAEF